MGTQKPAARRPPLAARHLPPATYHPNFSVPDLAAADNKIQNDRQKKTLLQR